MAWAKNSLFRCPQTNSPWSTVVDKRNVFQVWNVGIFQWEQNDETHVFCSMQICGGPVFTECGIWSRRAVYRVSSRNAQNFMKTDKIQTSLSISLKMGCNNFLMVRREMSELLVWLNPDPLPTGTARIERDCGLGVFTGVFVAPCIWTQKGWKINKRKTQCALSRSAMRLKEILCLGAGYQAPVGHRVRDAEISPHGWIQISLGVSPYFQAPARSPVFLGTFLLSWHRLTGPLYGFMYGWIFQAPVWFPISRHLPGALFSYAPRVLCDTCCLVTCVEMLPDFLVCTSPWFPVFRNPLVSYSPLVPDFQSLIFTYTVCIFLLVSPSSCHWNCSPTLR